ncbi:MAG: hypothetical protein ACI956_000274, partial [Nonlabens sp.]
TIVLLAGAHFSVIPHAEGAELEAKLAFALWPLPD